MTVLKKFKTVIFYVYKNGEAIFSKPLRLQSQDTGYKTDKLAIFISCPRYILRRTLRR